MRKILLTAIISILTVQFASAQDKPIDPMSQTPSPAEISVKPGPLELERKELLAMVLKAKEKNIGIQSYLNVFRSIEAGAQNGESNISLSTRIQKLNAALQTQLKEQEILNSPSLQQEYKGQKKGPQEKLLTLVEARNYMVSLINADRKKFKLGPLLLDPIASAAGQKHTDEMAANGFSGHWDLSGKKPTQRYTELGGTHNDSENVFFLGYTAKKFKLISSGPCFSPATLRMMQAGFMSEKPPDDGHRIQILSPEHNKVGIGLSLAKQSGFHDTYCLSQEFIDDYGTYEKIPLNVSVGKVFQIKGSLAPGFILYDIAIYWEELPKPMTVEELIKTGSYGEGANECIHSGAPGTDFFGLKVWKIKGRENFSVNVKPHRSWKPGLYFVRIWARPNKNKEPIVVSKRTMLHNPPDWITNSILLRSKQSPQSRFACQREK